MKSIQFDAVIPPRDPESPITEHRLYAVLLGNGIRCYFTSTRHAEQFQASAERLLNDALFRANLLLADLYPSWRMAWHYLDRIAPSAERDAVKAIRDAETAMDRALRKRGGADYVLYAWKDVSMAIGQARAVILVLVDLYRHKGHGVDRARLELLLEQCNELAARLRHWGGTVNDAPNATVIRPAL